MVSDVSIAVVELLEEMTDIEAVNENEEEAGMLLDGLVSTFIIYCLLPSAI